MYRVIISLFLVISSLFSAVVKEEKWPSGETFLTFLEKYSIPQKLYFDLEKEDKELCSEITADSYFYLIEDEDKTLNQVLIPVSEEIQLHVYKQNNGEYKFETLPISYSEYTETIAIPIETSVAKELQDATGSAALAANLKDIFAGSVNFRRMQKGDFVAIEYTQKELLGRPFGQPDIKAAMVEISGKKYYRFKNEDNDKYYDQTGKAFTKFYYFTIPLTYTRISSGFTQKRWHPVLKRYRAHLGTDFAAPRGRKIYAAAEGRIEFAGRKGGYGNVIIIKHPNGYKTLYGHQSKFRAGIKRGKWVKRGELIGYVGSTGLSSGPHLHLGLYINGRAVNPLKIIKKPEEIALKGKEKKTFIANAKITMQNLDLVVNDQNRKKATRLDRVASSSPIVTPKEI
ncbi:peptidoglycan DD-metalloendopeptidase family protein [Halarcobacter ebronensis]|uniref:Peptidase M24 n=1 Tax=Halarcobacter ebronensis TaxID=1462615 RepID=A0A4Q1ARY6_9BACT|nr:peptidoglycan DD-metalloendopeptidase family protein [Halarcobacter ebronensis]QKF82823.1 zinc metallopeptidase, M23 family [Halarcobacter ebronensis]RXK06844.1 peptidase M24 [Halarcobacter ebronensis]